jgi:hypothetical protein
VLARLASSTEEATIVEAQSPLLSSPPRGRRQNEEEEMAPDAVAGLPEVDVELVPASAAELLAGPGRGFSRRDWLLLGFGAAAVAAAILLGWLLAVIFE